MKIRTGEVEGTRFRSERFFTAEGEVYCSTREGLNLGPFESKKAASYALNIYIESIESGLCSPEKARNLAMNGRWASNHYE